MEYPALGKEPQGQDGKIAKDMQDRTPYVMVNRLADGEIVYRCSACHQMLARTMVPMEDEGLKNKMRSHHCQNSSKADFQKEIHG